jgi:Protein of unknown function (DUF3572)
MTGPEAAEHVAIRALSFIGADPERLGGFLAVTGLGPGDIRQAAREPRFLAGVLEFLAGDERLLLAFAESEDIDPVTVMFAIEALSGRRPESNDA